MSNENLVAHKYFRYNGASFIADPIAIKNLKVSQERSIIDNQKLGEYDLEGNYYISTEITKELLLLTKTISEFRANDPLKGGRDVYRLHANLPGFDKIEFLLEVDAKTATLFLLEKNLLEGGQYIETDEVFLKQFTSEKELNFAEIKKLFKIDEGDNNSGRNISPEEYSHIYLRKIYLNQVANTLSEITIKTERDSFEQAIEILKNSGDYGVKILKNFVERLNDRKDVVDNKDYMGYNKALNDILFSAIEMETSEEDLKNSKIFKIHNNIIAIRNAPIKDAIEEAKQSVTSLSVKGNLFEITKTDLPKQVVDAHFKEIAATNFVNNAVNKAKSNEIKLIRERDLFKPEEKVSDKKEEKTHITGKKLDKNAVIESEKPAYVFKNIEKSLTDQQNSDKLSAIQTGNRVVEERLEKSVKISREAPENIDKAEKVSGGNKPKTKTAKADKATVLGDNTSKTESLDNVSGKREGPSEKYAPNPEKVTNYIEPSIQSTNKEDKIQKIIDNAEKRRDLTDEEKAVIAAEYINKAGKRVVEDRPQADTDLIDNHVRDYRRFSEEEIAPAMEEVVSQHEEIKAAEATAAKPAEPTKPDLKLEEKETKESDLCFGDKQIGFFGKNKQDYEELVQEKIK